MPRRCAAGAAAAILHRLRQAKLPLGEQPGEQRRSRSSSGGPISTAVMARSRLARSGRRDRPAGRAARARPAAPAARPRAAAFSRCSRAASRRPRRRRRARRRRSGRSGSPDSAGAVRRRGAGARRPDVQQMASCPARLAPQRQATVRPLRGAAQPGAGVGVGWRRAEVACANRGPWKIGRVSWPGIAPAHSDPGGASSVSVAASAPDRVSQTLRRRRRRPPEVEEDEAVEDQRRRPRLTSGKKLAGACDMK